MWVHTAIPFDAKANLMGVPLRVLTAATVDKLATMDGLIPAMAQAYQSLSEGQASLPERGAVASELGTTLVMGASVPGQGLAAKVVSVFPGNRDRDLPTTMGLLLVLDPHTGAPVGLCDGAAVTAWRTGAASGLATARLARADAQRAAIIGCGAQARTQLLGIAAVRALSTVHIYGPRPARVRKFIEQMQPRTAAQLVAAETPAQAVEHAQIICTATSSSRPVIDGTMIRPGTHINAVGSFRLDMRELDETVVGRARVFVDHRPAAVAEAGDLVTAERLGTTRRADWTELGRVINGTEDGRTDDDQVTLFKSVGIAVQDVAAARVLFGAATQRKLGAVIEL